MVGIELSAGQYEATFHPDVAMLCGSFQFRDDEYVAWPRTLEQFKDGAATAVPLVHPWANRLGRRGYRVEDEEVDLHGLSLPVDPEGLPIHGNLLGAPFDVVSANRSRVVARLDYGAHPEKLRAFPFPHVLTVDARLHPTRGLNIVTQVEATGDRAVPISFGWHPYVQLPRGDRSGWELRWPACAHLELDEQLIPTGQRTSQAAQREAIGARTFDDHYALGRDRTFSISAEGRTLTFEFDAAYPFGQLFVPPDGQVAAIEPMTAEIDALGRGTAPRCRPGERFSAAFTMRVTAN